MTGSLHYSSLPGVPFTNGNYTTNPSGSKTFQFITSESIHSDAGTSSHSSSFSFFTSQICHPKSTREGVCVKFYQVKFFRVFLKYLEPLLMIILEEEMIFLVELYMYLLDVIKKIFHFCAIQDLLDFFITCIHTQKII